jgi:hypothetical protein
MKHMVRLEPGRFIHLDSYHASRETRFSKICVVALSFIMSAITVSAVVGIDITNPTPAQHHDNTQR